MLKYLSQGNATYLKCDTIKCIISGYVELLFVGLPDKAHVQHTVLESSMRSSVGGDAPARECPLVTLLLQYAHTGQSHPQNYSFVMLVLP